MSAYQKFTEFHNRNPHVLNRLTQMAFDLKERGHRRVGIEMLFNVIRWETMMEIEDPSSLYKLNNNYKPHYARMIMETYPELDGFFEVRELKAIT